MENNNETLDWPPQSGNTIDTGITGNGSTRDFWKYMKNELILHEIVTPLRIRMVIDALIEGTHAVQSLKPEEATSDSMETFTKSLSALSKETGLYIVGPQGVLVTSLRESRDYDVGHRAKRGKYRIVSDGKKAVEWPLLLD
jgi:hypothetical protein